MSEISHWNYRVRAYTAFTGVPGVEPEDAFEIIEVYYGEHGNIVAWGDTTGGFGNTLDQLVSDLENMREACHLPVLEDDDLPFPNGGDRGDEAAS